MIVYLLFCENPKKHRIPTPREPHLHSTNIQRFMDSSQNHHIDFKLIGSLSSFPAK